MGFDPVACRLTAWLLRGSGARFVVSSAWREGRTRAEMLAVLDTADLPCEHMHEDWATATCGSRGEEVLQWLSAHREVERWCVLDDGIELELVEEANQECRI